MNGKFPEWALNPENREILLYELSSAIDQKDMITGDDMIEIKCGCQGMDITETIYAAYCFGFLCGSDYFTE